MKTIKKSYFITLCIILLISLAATAENWQEFDLSNGQVNMHYVQHNPVKVNVEGLSKGIAVAQFRTEKYVNNTQVESTEASDLLQQVLTSKYDLNATLNNGSLLTTTENTYTKSQIYASGNVQISYSTNMSDGQNPQSKQVETLINADAEEGIIRINYDKPTVSSTTEEQVSKKLGISLRDAKNLLKNKGKGRVLNAIKKTDSNGNNKGFSLLFEGNGNPNGKARVAGGGGSIVTTGAIGVNQLTPGSVYQFYLQGPNYEARIEESKLDIRFFYPGNGTQIKGIGANLTVVGPVSGPYKRPKNVVLIASISYNKAKGYYEYLFEEGSWLVDLSQLKPGGYDLYIDLGPSLTTKLGITINQDHRVVEGRY